MQEPPATPSPTGAVAQSVDAGSGEEHGLDSGAQALGELPLGEEPESPPSAVRERLLQVVHSHSISEDEAFSPAFLERVDPDPPDGEVEDAELGLESLEFMRRASEQAWLELTKDHLEAFLEARPEAVYEDWVADLHPENAKREQTVEGPFRVDKRLYFADSDHLRLWNTNLRVSEPRRVVALTDGPGADRGDAPGDEELEEEEGGGSTLKDGPSRVPSIVTTGYQTPPRARPDDAEGEEDSAPVSSELLFTGSPV
eukprot:CAMPEP_0118972682 /NCGR_PEP_ID=MMETSP1173-20130426/8921_1 /TAXON_ID=1034831 /ORGANISM="Rhizochromulina marina cf, Strain CCMP1243" /LENGTH=255 /DNA_ID=CAMNT_0006922251 /DNA_START=37 /DNA_END=801 /DNA_ORIENTATION=+